MRLRATVAAVVTAVGSLALLVPHAQAAGQACYSVQVSINGGDVVNQAGCQDLP